MVKERAHKSILLKALSMFFFICVTVRADYRPPNGAEDFYSFISPSFWAGGSGATQMERPQSDVLNPSVSGLAQLAAFDFSYTALLDFRGEKGWGGHVVNWGGSHPTRAGVFNWSGRLLHSQFESADFGFVGTANLSLAKAIHENMLVGFGIGGGVSKNDVFDWALAGDLGFLHFPQIEKLPDLRWGVSLRDLGKTFRTATGRTAYPPPFTPVIGIELKPVQTKGVELGFSVQASFPSLQNFRLGTGLEMVLFDTISASVSSVYDLRQMIDPEIQQGSFVPRFGLAVRFDADSPFRGGREAERVDFKVQTAAGPLTTGVWGVGIGVNAVMGTPDKEPPVIEIDYRDELTLSFAHKSARGLHIGVRIDDERYIYGYSFVVEDSNGHPVRIVRSDFVKTEGTGLIAFFDGLRYVYSSIEIPASFSWDGRNDEGILVEDGVYRFYVTAWDDNGNTGVSKTYLVHLDSTPPRIWVEPMSEAVRVFSPNNDGNKDEIWITQEGSVEQLWTAIVSSNGETVRTYNWVNESPESFPWDGVGDDGTFAKDGIYSYTISATDSAGNSSVATLAGIVLDSAATPVGLTISRSHFSPNGDGRYDELVLTTKVPIQSGIESWLMKIWDSSSKTVRNYGGAAPVPKTVVFEGLSDQGKSVPEGVYTAVLEVTYINGNNPQSISPPFVIDITPPQASVTSDYRVFSPDGDGNKDIITFFQESSVEEEWIGEIHNSDGFVIMRYPWKETADPKVSWDGYAHGGLIAPNGTYSYRIYAEDRAGNKGGSREIFFNLDTMAATVFLVREFDAISPNADGIRDTQRLFPEVSTEEGIDSFTLWILNEAHTIVRTYTGRRQLEDYYQWDGRDDNGSRVPDGNYYARMEIRYLNGNKPTVNSRPFLVDTVFPTASSEPDIPVFSPNGDGIKDTVTFLNSSSSEDLWEARIVNGEGMIVRKVYWRDKVSSFVWNGTDDAGNLVPDGEYFFEVFTTDVAGNYTMARSSGVRLDSRTTPIFVTAFPDRFSPNGDGILEEVTLSTVVNDKKGVIFWKLTVMKTNGSVARVFEGNRVPERIVWNGRNDGGEVSDGEYVARFEVVYDMGNRPQAQTSPFYIDTRSPEVEVVYEPKPFSPDGDGVADVLELKVDVRDMSNIKRWSFTIIDPRGELFKQYNGTGAPPERMYWNGVSDDGELVQAAEDYPFEFYVEDVVGNGSAFFGAISVDVLVIEEKGNKRIRIPNFSFTPNSPKLDAGNRKLIEKNEWILERIAGICRRYADYYIMIEGHTVSVYWDDPERATDEQEKSLVPLSKARAETIKEALVRFGIDSARIETLGVGGAHPVVPHGNIENRWKNRRIEFILYK